ncbi:unnamed protein product [Durusdinium trenchii]|uniref:Uncharacterized protein n=1 Tax=Durusdinium trenchii TaxID=1381693 RepID=A0ABP0M8A3_9DINO
MAEVPADEVPQAEKEELFCTYAAMILKDSELDISEDNINTLIKAAGGSTSSFFPALFAKLCAGKDLESMLKSKGFQIAKAYSALQSLKRRYSISDGDADVVTVKEMLAAASSPNSLTVRALSLGKVCRETLLTHHSSKPAGLGAEVSSDLKLFSNNMLSGPAGWEREAESVVWNVEHIDHYGAASGLLRGIIEVAIVYLVCGAIYNYQMQGARGIHLIPHVGFWMNYPSLVMDGVKYATQPGAKASSKPYPQSYALTLGQNSPPSPVHAEQFA